VYCLLTTARGDAGQHEVCQLTLPVASGGEQCLAFLVASACMTWGFLSRPTLLRCSELDPGFAAHTQHPPMQRISATTRARARLLLALVLGTIAVVAWQVWHRQLTQGTVATGSVSQTAATNSTGTLLHCQAGALRAVFEWRFTCLAAHQLMVRHSRHVKHLLACLHTFSTQA
jgi:hypothetical protein